MTLPVTTSRPVPSRLARARGVLAFEWTKLRSVHSNYWTLLIAAAATFAVTGLVSSSMAAARVPPTGPINALTSSFLGYAEYTVLPVSVLGVLMFTTEYTTGLIQITFTAVPRRRVVIAAKAVVAGTAALITGELIAFASFFLTQAVLATHHRSIPMSRHGVAEAVLAAGFLLAACTLVGVGLGAVIRRTAGAIAATVAAIYLVAALCLVLPSPWNTRLGRFTLPFAAYQVVTVHSSARLLSPGLSMLVIIAWPAAALTAAAIMITHRDA